MQTMKQHRDMLVCDNTMSTSLIVTKEDMILTIEIGCCSAYCIPYLSDIIIHHISLTMA
jgi:cellobiose-specific phosphotransferase system component IIB